VRVGLGLLALALLWYLATVYWARHGHIGEPLDVTVRVVDAATGAPVAGAVVATVRWRGDLEDEDFERDLAAALEKEEAYLEVRHMPLPVRATRSTARAETTVHSSVWVTRSWIGPIRTRTRFLPPEALVVEHPRCGRIVVPIDPGSPLEEGDAPRTWRLDVGTVRMP